MFTDFLFARPSFLEGAARIVDIGGTLNEYNYSATPADADALAITADVLAVAQDMRVATRRVKRRRLRLGRSCRGQALQSQP